MVLIIIFGWRGVTYTKDKGAFHCPSCAVKKQFNRKRVRRFFTIYFIPLIPLNLVGEYIECAGCKRTFNEDVLAFDPNAENAEFLAQFQTAIKRIMVLMMLADGKIDPEEVETIKRIYGQISDATMTQEDVDAEVTAAKAMDSSLIRYMRDITPMLNSEGKEMVMRSAIMMAADLWIFRS